MILTNWNHALSVVVQVLLDNLKQTPDRPPRTVAFRALCLTEAQVLVLLLHLGECLSQAPHNALIRCLVALRLHQQAEVEDELIAHVLGMWDDHRESQDGVLAIGRVDGDIAVAEGLARDDVLLQNVEVDERRPLAIRGGDAAWRSLSDDFGAWNEESCLMLMDWHRESLRFYLLEGRIERRRCLESWRRLHVHGIRVRNGKDL